MSDKRLLICDDEPAFGRFVKIVAQDQGFEVETTTAAAEFMAAYRRFQPTTIVLDMVMPGMDGNELVLWLAEQRCSARIIIITGYTPDYAMHAKVLAEFKGLGPVRTLKKPVEIDELRAALATC